MTSWPWTRRRSSSWLLDDITGEMVFYGPDNVTELVRFQLYDKDGNIITCNPGQAFERRRIIP